MIAFFNDYFFRPVLPYHLGLIRVLFCLWFLAMGEIMWDVVIYNHAGQTFQPIGFFQFIGGPYSEQTFLCMKYIWYALVVAVLFGLGRHYILWPMTFVSMFAGGYGNNFGKVIHCTQMINMCLIILCLSPCFDAITASDFFKKKEKEKSWHYRWPIGLMCCLVILSMFTLGVQKLYFEGWDWVFSERFYLTVYTAEYLTPLAQWVVKQPNALSVFMAFYGAIIVEVLAPLAFLPRLRPIFPFIWASFHLVVTASFGAHVLFWSQILVYLNFYDLNYWFRKYGCKDA